MAGASGGGREPRNYDQYLKWLLTRAHDDFLALVAPGMTYRGERSPQLPAVPRYADLVWEVENQAGEAGLLDIELQTRSDAEMGERVAEYGIRLWREAHLPVRSLVVYARQDSGIQSPPFVIAWGGYESLRYRYEVVRLWTIPYQRVTETAGYALWPLAALMRGIGVDSTVAIAQRLLAAQLPREERTDLVGLLIGLLGARIASQQVLEALRSHPMIDELLNESSVTRAFFEKGREAGKAEGMAEGKAEGMAEGKAEGEREMAQRLAQQALEGRFTTLDEDMTAAIRAASTETLQALVGHVATESLAQLRARLGLSR